MQVSLEATSGLGRKLTVEIPPERIDPEVDKRLKSMSRRVNVAGFRPGKVPMRIVKQRFGDQVLREVTEEVLRDSFQEAVVQKALRPAGGPHIHPGELGAGRGLKYTAEFEVYPEFELAPIEEMEIRRPEVDITDADIDAMVETVREQRKTWNEVERAAASGNQVLIDFHGSIEGTPFAGGEGQDVAIELGAERMLSGFEDQLIGVSKGDEKKVRITFPDDHPNHDVAGKAADFDVTVKSVSAAQLPALDDSFAQSLGVTEGNVEGLRKAVRVNMVRELEQKMQERLKTQVMDGLVQRNEVELPESMVKHEIDHARDQVMKNMELPKSRNINQPDEPRLPDELFVDEARRRVKLGLVVGEIVRRHELKPDQDNVQAALQALASSYDEPQQVIDYYRRNRSAMANVEATVMEAQIVEWVVARARTTPEKLTFNELVRSPATPAQPADA
ncbi:MAG: trigger factor [Gammaproteobacteria bacterium]|nr:trigger factor [Gammaproteobacteria bacterium]